MLRPARLLSLLVLGCMASPAWAEGTVSDPQSLPCNALCRRWMGLGEGTVSEPPPLAAERQTVETTAPVVASSPPAPVVTRRPDPSPVVRPAPAVAAAPKSPVKAHREQRTVEARRAPSPAPVPRELRPEAPPPRRPAEAMVVGRAGKPGAVPHPAGLPGPSTTMAIAVAQPVAIAAHVAEPARAVRTIDFVLPLLEQPPPPVIVAPAPARADALPPAFDVIATLLLTAPPRR